VDETGFGLLAVRPGAEVYQRPPGGQNDSGWSNNHHRRFRVRRARIHFYWALRNSFERTGHPRNLTVIGACPQGGRGMAPGTIEELDAPGIITRYIVGHGETAKALLRLADEGKLELHTMSQGTLAFLIEAQAKISMPSKRISDWYFR